jgi:peroxiredoxin
MLSDERQEFTDALGLPTFEVDGLRLIRRLTRIARQGRIEDVLHPVLRPERSAQDGLAWFKLHPIAAAQHRVTSARAAVQPGQGDRG